MNMTNYLTNQSMGISVDLSQGINAIIHALRIKGCSELNSYDIESFKRGEVEAMRGFSVESGTAAPKKPRRYSGARQILTDPNLTEFQREKLMFLNDVRILSDFSRIVEECEFSGQYTLIYADLNGSNIHLLINSECEDPENPKPTDAYVAVSVKKHGEFGLAIYNNKKSTGNRKTTVENNAFEDITSLVAQYTA